MAGMLIVTVCCSTEESGSSSSEDDDDDDEGSTEGCVEIERRRYDRLRGVQRFMEDARERRAVFRNMGGMMQLREQRLGIQDQVLVNPPSTPSSTSTSSR